MTIRILLHLAILSTLSMAALGQTDTLTKECLDALTNFTRETACFGSEDGVNGFFTAFNSTSGSMTSSMEGLNDPNVQRVLVTFYSNLCTSQDCVTSYANVIDVCFRSALAQVCIAQALI